MRLTKPSQNTCTWLDITQTNSPKWEQSDDQGGSAHDMHNGILHENHPTALQCWKVVCGGGGGGEESAVWHKVPSGVRSQAFHLWLAATTDSKPGSVYYNRRSRIGDDLNRIFQLYFPSHFQHNEATSPSGMQANIDINIEFRWILYTHCPPRVMGRHDSKHPQLWTLSRWLFFFLSKRWHDKSWKEG